MRSSHSPRRSSSGYFSNESNSVPPSPVFPRPQTADEATQTVSLSAQAIEHAVSSLSTAPVRQEHTQVLEYGKMLSRKKLTAPRNMLAAVEPVRDMQAVLIGQELRQHGDEFNRILEQRAAEVRADWRPAVPREPAVIVCMGLLIFLFGRLLYSHSATYSQSQV
ncbi:hypothetical protein NL108_006198 [Boleophthalmus pectinirostris]|nr:hypothetical protein NL108_006198 [Boleophthalmus pectinirostris]